MLIRIIKYPLERDWLDVRNNALCTRRKSTIIHPDNKLRTKFLVCEHSTIRSLEYIWQWEDIPYWVSVHITRHNQGITHFVSSQRNDVQNKYDRREAPQNALTNHRCVANAQAILNISRARLCKSASIETRDVWNMFLTSIKDLTPELYNLCVKPCIYRNGICPEVFNPCGFNKTELFKTELDKYIEVVNMQ